MRIQHRRGHVTVTIEFDELVMLQDHSDDVQKMITEIPQELLSPITRGLARYLADLQPTVEIVTFLELFQIRLVEMVMLQQKVQDDIERGSFNALGFLVQHSNEIHSLKEKGFDPTIFDEIDVYANFIKDIDLTNLE